MTTELAGRRDYPGLSGGIPPQTRPRVRPLQRGRLFGMRAGQLISTQIAAVLLVVGAVLGPIALAGAAMLAVILLAITWLRLRGRWAFERIGVGKRYSGRPHTVTLDSSPTAVLQLASPGARIEQTELGGDQATVIVDGHGITAILELGDPAGLLAEDLLRLPTPASLLPPAGGPDHPPCRVQMIFTGVPAPSIRAGNGTPANSYRQLYDGRLLGHTRALIAVRVLSGEGWSAEDLRRSLSGLVRKIPRRLGELPARPLGEAAALRVIGELAHDDAIGPAQEMWPGLRIGGLTQATYRLDRWPDLAAESAQRLIGRMLALPAAATTVSLTAGPRHENGAPTVAVDLTVRLAAPDQTTLGFATQALRKMVAAERGHVRRLDGEHLAGFAATLPLGGGPLTEVPGRPADGALPPAVMDGLDLSFGAAGMMVGRNRAGEPVVARMFRPEQTRALLVGGVRCAQLISLRAMALGARVVVQTARPQAWEPFVRGAAVPGEAIAVVPPGRAVEIPPGSPLHPLLVVVDVGPVGADPRPGAGWQATLVVRDDFSAADIDVASRADLLIVQPLRADEANLMGTAIGLGETAQWLTRIRPDMVGLINRRAVRWAALAQTPIEAQLIGPPGR